MKLLKYSISASLILFLLISTNTFLGQQLIETSQNAIFPSNQLKSVLVSTDDPFYSIISSPLACWYNETSQFLHPLLLIQDKIISTKQMELLSAVKSTDNVLSIGFNPTNLETTSLLGSPVTVSQQIAKTYFQQSNKAVILPYNHTTKAYETSLIASPLASYLHMPILLYDTEFQNYQELIDTLGQMNTTTLYLMSSINSTVFENDYELIVFQNNSHIQKTILNTINERFRSLNYITITNPTDVKPQEITNTQHTITEIPVHNTMLYLLGKKIILQGTDTISTDISIPEGIHKLEIKITIKNSTSAFNLEDTPRLISANLKDSTGRTLAYGYSPGYSKNATYLETFITNYSGKLSLSLSFFQGYRGGYFSIRGFSHINALAVIEQQLNTLSTPQYPFVSNLSQNAAYLTSAHGGIILADKQFSLIDDNYTCIPYQHATGPWYDETLHQYNNDKVMTVVKRIEENLSYLESCDLLDGYVNGSGWLALLGDTNMIPMFYYPSNQTNLAERGLPSDNPYSLNHQLSPGRIMSYTTSDASLLIARTLFYSEVCGPVQDQDDWHQKFNFVFGEGFGETGGIFHQIPYANSIESYGFKTTVYGDFRNGLQTAERLHVYDDANYVEYLGHGDWYWFTPSIYGFNSVGQSIGCVNIREWNINRPNVILTSACLMGRVDGVPPMMSIALSFLHSGSNAFIGATRETGQEAGLTILENHLIIDDFSLGEALRGEKRVDKETPTYYVRCLFGDPAFNPYDPLHGFSDQGMPFS